MHISRGGMGVKNRRHKTCLHYKQAHKIYIYRLKRDNFLKLNIILTAAAAAAE